MGKNHFMLGDYREATQLFEKALALNPRSSEYELWLGRAYGKRAETGGWLTAPSNASKARQHFEKAAALDAHNAEALNDLFDYYLNAPGILGGGLDKAEAAARQIAAKRPAEYHFELAEIAERRKQYPEAEDHLRRAMELAPGSGGPRVGSGALSCKTRPDCRERRCFCARRASFRPTIRASVSRGRKPMSISGVIWSRRKSFCTNT